MITKNIIAVLFVISVVSLQVEASDSGANLIAIGQGISSPNSTSTVNYSNGFTSENPVGVLYQNSSRLSLQYDQNDSGNSKGFGAEVGYGKKDFGLAVGYYKNDCSNCEGRFAADLAASSGSFGFGIRLAEDNYALGLLFGVTDSHRLGAVIDINNTGGTGNKISSVGLGYSYVSSNFTLTLDASKRDNENNTVNNEILIVTPGISLRAGELQLSVNDRITVDNTNNTKTEDLWVGVGYGGKSWHLVGYSDYVNDLALVFSIYF